MLSGSVPFRKLSLKLLWQRSNTKEQTEDQPWRVYLSTRSHAYECACVPVNVRKCVRVRACGCVHACAHEHGTKV